MESILKKLVGAIEYEFDNEKPCIIRWAEDTFEVETECAKEKILFHWLVFMKNRWLHWQQLIKNGNQTSGYSDTGNQTSGYSCYDFLRGDYKWIGE